MLLELGKILESIKYETLPEVTREKAKVTLLNFLATGLAAANAPAAEAEISVWSSVGGAGDCVILGHSGRVSPLAAASVNAMMGQIYLFEDCHEHTLSHPGVVAIPVALALGQKSRASGKQVVEAIVSGYEAIGRIGAVLIAPGFPSFGQRPASTLAPFGGAAAAAKIFALDSHKTCDALAIAGNTASGVMEFVNSGAEDICLQNCFAAKNSIMAAMLAMKGIKGSASILDGHFGLGKAMNRKELDWSPALKAAPGHYMIDESFIKRFPGCGHVLATAQAAMALVAENEIATEEIEKVTIGVSKGGKEFPGVDYCGPYTGTISAMMSHQFMTASVLVFGEVSAKTVDMFDNPDIANIARKINVEVDEQVNQAAPHKTGAKIKILLKSGKEVSNYQQDIIPLNRDEVIERFISNAEDFFTSSQSQDIIDKALNLELLESVDELMSLLGKR
ncbi:MAG: MmgE/PrpD family protein [Oscillospiraceae bacterium]|nr:MmgE/PrpD family protein [Oscillospiraceae bacterium]